jgi:hypothetical protein
MTMVSSLASPQQSPAVTADNVIQHVCTVAGPTLCLSLITVLHPTH